MPKAAALFCLAMLIAFLPGCKTEPLTKEKAQELLEASDEFQPQTVHVRLTDDEIRKGTEAGYWSLVQMNRTNSALPSMQIISLTPIGAALFRGAPMLSLPSMQINQKLGGRVIEITKIEDDAANPKQKNVEYTWTRRFENLVPELVEMFKDQPPQQAKKKFRYGKSGWELVP